MDSNLIFSLTSSIALIAISFYLKYTNEKTLEQPQRYNGNLKKHWYIFLIVGVICLSYDIYRIVTL